MKDEVIPTTEISLPQRKVSIHSVPRPYYGYDCLKKIKSKLSNPVEVPS